MKQQVKFRFRLFSAMLSLGAALQLITGCSSATSPGPNAPLTPNVWSSISSVGFTPRAALSSCVVGGKIYALGGTPSGDFNREVNTVEVYDPLTNTWSTPVTTGNFAARRSHTSSAVNGKIYVIGGVLDDSMGKVVTTVQMFDPSTSVWSTLNTTGSFTPRFGHVAVVVGSKIYCIGGETSGPVLTTNDVFDVSTNTWSTLLTSGTYSPNEFHTGDLIGGKIYTIGGMDGHADSLEQLEVSANAWSVPSWSGPMLNRYGHTTGVVNGKIFASGGISRGKGVLTQMFDPASGVWSTLTTAGTPLLRAFGTSSTIDGKIYVIGGMDTVGMLHACEVFTP